MPTPPDTTGEDFGARPLPRDQIIRLLDAIPKTTLFGIRLRAMIGFIYATGTRISECLNVMPHDLDYTRHTVFIKARKGDGLAAKEKGLKIKKKKKKSKAETIAILDFGIDLVLEWVEARKPLNFDSSVPLFSTLDGRRLTRKGFSNSMKLYAKKAGIDQRVHPHILRHSFAYEAAEAGVPMHKIQQQLGHSNLSTTETYINHLNPSDMVEAFRDAMNWSIK